LGSRARDQLDIGFQGLGSWSRILTFRESLGLDLDQGWQVFAGWWKNQFYRGKKRNQLIRLT